MRELLVTMTLISLMSAEEFEPQKRFGIPPEVDPNFWPARGRRSYWNNPRLFGNSIRRDLTAVNPDVDYSGHSNSWSTESDYLSNEELVSYPENWRLRFCPRKNSISLVLPLQEFNPEETDIESCEGRCNGAVRGRGRSRGRRGGERRWRNQPLYAEEPGWITLDYAGGVLKNSENEDPFIVARGKKRNEQIFNINDIRVLDDALNSYETSDPFFVARGKRNVEKNESEIRKKVKSSSSIVGAKETPNEFQSKLKRMKKDSKLEEAEVSSAVNQNFSKTQPSQKSEDYKNQFFVNPTTIKYQIERHPRSQRSPTDVFQSNDDKWTISSDIRQVASPQTNQQFRQVVKPRYSRPRDKHSNLQSILDEPFFISRGKKNDNQEEEYFTEETAPGIKIDDAEELDEKVINKIVDLPEFADIYRQKNNNDLSDYDLDNEFKLLRNRRGMLDDLLKSDDPFYVARGKKFYSKNGPNRSAYFDMILKGSTARDDAAATKQKYSLFAESTRTKLLEKLYDFSKINTPKNFVKSDSSKLINDNRHNDVN